MPLYIDKNQENLPVIALYPPPQLHCGILGPVNNIIVIVIVIVIIVGDLVVVPLDPLTND